MSVTAKCGAVGGKKQELMAGLEKEAEGKEKAELGEMKKWETEKGEQRKRDEEESETMEEGE